MDVSDLRERLIGQRFYDRSQDEAFTVVGITPSPPLALLQYDDGVAWDEGATNFTVSGDVAEQVRLDEHGLDSDRYRSLGPGPRIDQICDPEDHAWHPWPDELWPGGPSPEVREQMSDHPRSFYGRIVRCKRCGLSGSVAGQFGFYGSDAQDAHEAPWFCLECGEAHAGSDLVYQGDAPFCSDCASMLDDDGI